MPPKALDAVYFNFDAHGFLDPSIEKELIKFNIDKEDNFEDE